MTETEKQSCLALRYKFRDYYDDMRGRPQKERHEDWHKFVNISRLTKNEKKLCKREFIPLKRER